MFIVQCFVHSEPLLQNSGCLLHPVALSVRALYKCRLKVIFMAARQLCMLRRRPHVSRMMFFGVGAQSTLGGHKIFTRKICIKNQQNARILHNSCPKNYQNTRIFIFARKIYKISEFYMIFARKMPEFYIIIARKIFFPNFRGARAPSPRLLRLPVRGGCVYVLQMLFVFFSCFFSVRQKYETTVLGTAERIFMKLLPNDRGDVV